MNGNGIPGLQRAMKLMAFNSFSIQIRALWDVTNVGVVLSFVYQNTVGGLPVFIKYWIFGFISVKNEDVGKITGEACNCQFEDVMI